MTTRRCHRIAFLVALAGLAQFMTIRSCPAQLISMEEAFSESSQGDGFQLVADEEVDAPKRPPGPPGPMGGGQPGVVLTWSPEQSVSSQDAELSLFRQNLSLGGPVWRKDRDMLMARISVQETNIHGNAILPDSLREMPSELMSVNLGLSWMHQFENGWMGGVNLGIGSASDAPFASIREMTFMAGTMLRVPATNERDAWVYSLMYMYGGPANFPIPGLAYSWNPSDQLSMNIGFPFSLAWKPSDTWNLDVSYMPLNNLNTRATWHWTDSLSSYLGYEIVNESYFLEDRLESEERFFAVEQRAITGIRWKAWRNASLEGFGGYSFGRHFGAGQNQWESLTDRIDLDAGPFLGAAVRIEF